MILILLFKNVSECKQPPMDNSSLVFMEIVFSDRVNIILNRKFNLIFIYNLYHFLLWIFSAGKMLMLT